MKIVFIAAKVFLEQVYANDLTLLLPLANLAAFIRGILVLSTSVYNYKFKLNKKVYSLCLNSLYAASASFMKIFVDFLFPSFC